MTHPWNNNIISLQMMGEKKLQYTVSEYHYLYFRTDVTLLNNALKNYAGESISK